jgi:hypothetical protein
MDWRASCTDPRCMVASPITSVAESGMRWRMQSLHNSQLYFLQSLERRPHRFQPSFEGVRGTLAGPGGRQEIKHDVCHRGDGYDVNTRLYCACMHALCAPVIVTSPMSCKRWTCAEDLQTVARAGLDSIPERREYVRSRQ